MAYKSLLMAAMAFVVGAPAVAQDYPSKPITLVAAYAAGGGTDRLARLFADSLQEKTGTPVVVENRAGATGTLGANHVANAKPDGHTLLFSATSEVTIVKYTMGAVPYDIYNDFSPIGRVAYTPYVIITNNNVPGESLEELESYIAASDSPVPIGAVATISRLTAELFRVRSGLPTETILYNTPAMGDLLGDQIRVSVDVLPTALPQLEAGNVKARVVASADRSELLPDVPTMEESGYPDFVSTVWYSLLAPKDTPPEIVAELSSLLQEIVSDEAVKEQLRAQGYSTYEGDTAEAFGAFLEAETNRWGSVVAETGFTR
ncbi:Bug family tripartite tricarboxylate transporter substrate binding protein [Marinimicrococcus flavescens]|uniref:Tripartite tricarboxylate transporter substrate binding protein n=1 Tax=Marinimicrococcus flavescens TaxID=3031815 RepID=A0AAP4D5B6_9PROT|nr:tripartite tricarboxylate transporter substrate binding protein [Marinimicrococcus flavescens]